MFVRFHWFPVKFRIDFKILLPTFNVIYGHAPGSLIDLIAIKEQQRFNHRSASGLILKYPSLKLKKTLEDRAFSSAARNLWNNLPLITSVLRTILNSLNFLLKRIFLDQLLVYNVFNLLCNIFRVFLALFTFSLSYYAHLSLYFLLTFTASVLTRF